MRQIRLSRGTDLTFMLLCRENIGAAHKFQVVTRMMFFDAVEDFFQTDHLFELYGIKSGAQKEPRIGEIRGSPSAVANYLVPSVIPPGPLFFSAFFLRVSRALLNHSSA